MKRIQKKTNKSHGVETTDNNGDRNLTIDKNPQPDVVYFVEYNLFRGCRKYYYVK